MQYKITESNRCGKTDWNAVPYLKTKAKIRQKNVYRQIFCLFCLFYFAVIIRLLSSEENSYFWFFAEEHIKLKVSLIFCHDASLKHPGVRLRTLTWLAAQFNLRDTIYCRSEVYLGYGPANSSEKCSKPVTKKSKCLQICCPSVSVFFLVKFGNFFSSLIPVVVCTIWPVEFT